MVSTIPKLFRKNKQAEFGTVVMKFVTEVLEPLLPAYDLADDLILSSTAPCLR